MLKRADEISKRADTRAGLIAATLYNVNRHDRNDKVFAPHDFFPWLKPKEDEAEITPESQRLALEKLRGWFGGTITTKHERGEGVG